MTPALALVAGRQAAASKTAKTSHPLKLLFMKRAPSARSGISNICAAQESREFSA
jgi:hypothetical protein